MHYISTGSHSKMYTLRTRFTEIMAIQCAAGVRHEEVLRDVFVRNLSIDKAKAVQKASDLGFDVQEADFDLEDIRRRSAEEMEAARKRAEKEHEERDAEFGRLQRAQIEAALRGIMPVGQHSGKSLTALRLDKGYEYALYWIKQIGKGDPVGEAIGKFYDKECPEVRKYMIEGADGSGKHFGEQSKRFKGVNIMEIAYFSFEGFYGRTYIVKYIEEETGALLVYKGANPPATSTFKTVNCDFTVKAFDEYKGVNQTSIQRIKIK